jgi:Tfp pilus tip-associated adhesin PilY1
MSTRKTTGWLALLMSIMVALPQVSMADDQELFSSRANPNMLLMLDVTGSMSEATAPGVPALYDTSSTGNRKMDALWKVVYTLLNANLSIPTGTSGGVERQITCKLDRAKRQSNGDWNDSMRYARSYNEIQVTDISNSDWALLPLSDPTGTQVFISTSGLSVGIQYTGRSTTGTKAFYILGGQTFSPTVTFPQGSTIYYQYSSTSSSTYTTPYPQSNTQATTAPYRNNLTSADGKAMTDEQTLKLRIGVMTFEATGGGDHSPRVPNIKTRNQVYPSSPNSPPFTPNYLSIWDNVTTYAKPGGYTPSAVALDCAVTYFKTATSNNTVDICRKNVAVMITDGADTVGGVPITSGPITGTGTGSSVSFGTDNTPDTDTMLRYNAVIQEAAILKSSTGAPPVELYTIGLGINAVDQDTNILREVLRRAAEQGNSQMTAAEYRYVASYGDNTSRGAGRAFFTTDATELAAAMAVIVKRTTSGLLSFTAPTVASIRMTDRNYLFKASFCPQQPPATFWEGSLQAYALTDNGTIINPPLWDDNTVLATASPSDRRIYTADNTSGTWGRLNFGVNPMGYPSGIDNATLGLSGGTGTGSLFDNVVKYVRGTRQDNNAVWQNNYSKLGDIFHSKPVVVGPPSRFYFDTGYSTPAGSGFADLKSDRPRVLYVGTNDGLLHAFLTARVVSGRYVADSTMGTELFAYLPNKLLTKMENFYPGVDTDHDYYVDSSPRVADVWIDGYAGYPDLSGANGTKEPAEWRTVLISGMRKGGSGYFALDITNPSESYDTNYPKVLWEYWDDTNLGNSWSEPFIGKVRIKDSASSTDLKDRWVAVFGGGTDTFGSVGKSLTVLDIATGRRLKIFGAADGIDNVIPASPTAVLDSNGYIRYVYVADLDGSVYKFNFVLPGVGTTSAGSAPIDNWTVSKIFQAPAGQPTYHRIEISEKSETERYLFFGTGNQEFPISDSGTGKFFGIIDSDSVVRTTPLYQSNLDNVTLNLWANGATPSTSVNGWFVDLYNVSTPKHSGEKVLSDPVVFYNNVYFTTFQPSSSDACSGGGTARVYGLRISDAYGGLSALSGETGNAAGKVPYHEYGGTTGSAGGVPSSPSLSIYPSGVSSLFVGFSTGVIEKIEIDSPAQMKSIKSWKEIF